MCVWVGGASSSTWRCTGVSMVYVVCVCVCVFDPKVFCEKHYRRSDVGQSANVCCKVKLLKQCIIVGYLGRIALSMIDRAGGWMEWTGLVKGRAGAGDGDWGGEGGGEGGVTTALWDYDAMITGLCVC